MGIESRRPPKNQTSLLFCFVYWLFKTKLEFSIPIFVFLPHSQPGINGQKKEINHSFS